MDTDSIRSTLKMTLEPYDAYRLAELCGELDSHIQQMESRFDADIRRQGCDFLITACEPSASAVKKLIQTLYHDAKSPDLVTPDHVHLAIQEAIMDSSIESSAQPSASKSTDICTEDAGNQTASCDVSTAFANASIIKTKKATIKPRGERQSGYVMHIRRNDINFGIGPAGTGKTYLAVACAVESLLQDDIERILLVRPAVEAGEKLGFLPGDLSQKVDPYLRPLYDALYEMLGFETVEKLIERNVIEVAPLAYMRGRTLNNAFVILDESQNTTREQMKMFLTRIGFGSTAVITGDPSQVDLPKGHASGLKHAMEVLENVEDISFTFFTSKDVVRHPIVMRIVEAYERAEKKAENIEVKRKAARDKNHSASIDSDNGI